MRLVLLLVVLLVSTLGFSKAVRKYIFWRDDGTCQDCGRRWDDGWMLHAAHNDHCFNGNGGAKVYNDPANGKLRCVDCHIKQHRQLMNKAKSQSEKNKNAQAIRKLKKLDKRNYNFYRAKNKVK